MDDKKDVPAGIRNKITFKSVKTSRNPDKTSHNPYDTTDNPQRKVKESKSKDSKGEDKAAYPPNGGAESRIEAVPVLSLILNDKSEYPIYEEQVREWSALYPAVNVIQQLRNMKGWLDANPTKRKTRKGIMRFINGWLSKEQDRGPANYTQGGGNTSGRNEQYGGHSGRNEDWQKFQPSKGRGFRENDTSDAD